MTLTPAMYFDNIILDTVDFQAQVDHKSHRVRRLNDRASHKGTRRLIKTNKANKGNRPINPIARQNRETIDLRSLSLSDEISEQERMNILSAVGHNVSPADIRMAREVCRLALKYSHNDKDHLWDNLDMEWFYADTPEREIALVTFVSQTRWYVTDNNIEMWEATDLDCFSAIEAKEYLPLFKEGKIGLEFIEARGEEVK